MESTYLISYPLLILLVYTIILLKKDLKINNKINPSIQDDNIISKNEPFINDTNVINDTKENFDHNINTNSTSFIDGNSSKEELSFDKKNNNNIINILKLQINNLTPLRLVIVLFVVSIYILGYLIVVMSTNQDLLEYTISNQTSDISNLNTNIISLRENLNKANVKIGIQDIKIIISNVNDVTLQDIQHIFSIINSLGLDSNYNEFLSYDPKNGGVLFREFKFIRDSYQEYDSSLKSITRLPQLVDSVINSSKFNLTLVNNDNYSTVNFLIGRKLDNSTPENTAFMVFDYNKSKNAVLITDRQDLNIGRMYSLFVESLGNQPLTITNVVNSNTYETTEYYETYNTISEDLNPDKYLKIIHNANLSLQEYKLNFPTKKSNMDKILINKCKPSVKTIANL